MLRGSSSHAEKGAIGRCKYSRKIQNMRMTTRWWQNQNQNQNHAYDSKMVGKCLLVSDWCVTPSTSPAFDDKMMGTCWLINVFRADAWCNG